MLLFCMGVPNGGLIYREVGLDPNTQKFKSCSELILLYDLAAQLLTYFILYVILNISSRDSLGTT
jgi:hypothetical protein